MIEMKETFCENHQSILKHIAWTNVYCGDSVMLCYVMLYEFRAAIMKDDGIIDSDPIWFRLEWRGGARPTSGAAVYWWEKVY